MRNRWKLEERLNDGGAASGPFTDLALVSSAVDGTDQTIYTFTAMNVGAANASRLVIACVTARSATSVTLTSITIGGVTATVDMEARNTSGAALSDAIICHAIVPTGTTADVVVTMSGACVRAGCGLYSTLLYANVTPTATAQATRAASVGTMQPSLTSPGKGFVVGVAYSSGGLNQLITTAHTNIGNLASFAPIVDCQNNASAWPNGGMIKDLDANTETGAGAAVMAAAVASWKYP